MIEIGCRKVKGSWGLDRKADQLDQRIGSLLDQANGRNTLVFDVDGTIYDRSCGLNEAVHGCIVRIFDEVTGRPGDHDQSLFTELTRAHGTALLGLHFAYGIPMNDLLSAAHNVDHTSFLGPTPSLAIMLDEEKRRKVLFSNAPRTHIDSVLQAMGLSGRFDLMVAAEDCYPFAKPQPAAFDQLSRMAGCSLRDMVIFDDKLQTARQAVSLHMTTVLITSGRKMPIDVDLLQFRALSDALEALAARRRIAS